MEKEDNIKKQLLEEIRELRIRLEEANEPISAIRGGGVDAIVVSGLPGEQVFTLTGAELAYRVLIETMNEGAASLNREGLIIYSNQRLSEMIKTPLEKVTGATMRQFIRASDHPVFDSLMEKRLQECGKGEVALINNDGTVLPVLLSISALQKDNANICGITVTDLTAQKHIEDELKRHRNNLEELAKERTNELETSNQLLLKEIAEREKREENILNLAREWQKTFDAIPSSVFLLDVEGRITRGNKATELLLGKTQDDIIGLPCWELMHGTDNPIPECPIPSMKKERKRISVIIPAKDRWLQVTVDPILDEAGELIGAVHTIDDVTEHKLAHDALRVSEERFRQIAESVEEWIWEFNCDGLYTYASPIVEEILGYKPEEIVGQKLFYDLYPSDMREQMKKVAFEFFATKRAFNKYGSFAVHKNGGIVSLDISGLPILDSRGDLLGYRGICINTTEYRKLEAQLRHAQKMEAVGTLAGGIAHDFNNILNVIIGYGSMVYDSIEADSHSKKQMNEVLIAADRAVTLTKRLLVFSRKNVIEVKPVNINELILGLQKMLDRIIRESIDFTLEIADRHLIVLADAGLIEQVLLNLVSNARDAMQEKGRLTISTGLEEMNDEYVTASGYGKPGKYALITVSDTGQGMDAETQKKIFEPFFTTKGIGEGTGLGLAISYGIIKQHGGFINVYSEPGHGTVFKIYLPLTEKTASPDMKTDAAFPVKGGNETVLVAEDDASLREVTRIILESFGYTVISAVDGEDAITKFMENRERISLALIDMIMPKKNGKEAGEAMRRVRPLIKILYESGYPMDIIKTDELTEAGVDFIHKPFPPRDLLIKVRELLDR